VMNGWRSGHLLVLTLTGDSGDLSKVAHLGGNCTLRTSVKELAQPHEISSRLPSVVLALLFNIPESHKDDRSS
jgi:hypothetical protein